MAEYRIGETVLDIPFNAMLLDTNVLVAAFFDEKDSDESLAANYILSEHSSLLLVPSMVVVEAWGSLQRVEEIVVQP
jgi:predicted nucleic acid-binding protein